MLRYAQDHVERAANHEELHNVIVPLRIPVEWQSAGFAAIYATIPDHQARIEVALAPPVESNNYAIELG